ncbi:alpha/beta fold hydrolase [Aneurinibacillus sp. BA2021]|nr:alpha/beta fold hydrolase [Aneurinibacillus sp. BA2021]
MVDAAALRVHLAAQKERKEQLSTASRFIDALQKGQFDKAVRDFSPALLQVRNEKQMKGYWEALPKELNAGTLKEIGKAVWKDQNTVHTHVDIPLVFEKATVPISISLNKQGQIDDFSIFLTPSAPKIADDPTYSKKDAFVEKEVTIGEGTFALPGTLTMPKGDGPFPAIVLVHGSGALDQDETAFALKPFRDLAHGLASQNIAVLRYNKRTFEHPSKTMFDPNHTVDKETTDDALLAVKLLANTANIDKNQVYVLGHSQGGLMLPRILEKGANSIAGGISLAGPARTLPDVMLDQFDYLASIGQLPKEQLEPLKKQVEYLKDPNFSGKNPPKDFNMGLPMFWDSIRNIAAAADAKNQTTPLLLLQGERDYQVTADPEFTIWKETLAHRSDVTYRLYPKLNHFFTEGEGQKSKPDEYFVPANIPSYVIDDIAAWIAKSKK